MAFSQTVSQTTFSKRKVIDRAYSRCRLLQQQITGEMIDDASDELHLMFSTWANQQIPLWCIETAILPMYEGKNALPAGVGTVDVLDANFRSLTEVTGTNTDTSTTRSVQFSESTSVTTVGVKWSGTPVNLTFSRSDDGSTWTTVTTATVDEASGEWTWTDMPTVVSALYFRVVGSSTLSFSSIFMGNSPREVPMSRWNRQDWFNTVDKSATSDEPHSYWFDRQVAQPVLRVWPTPTETAEESQILIHRQRYIMDVGTMVQELEVPQRWLDAVVYGLAARLALSTAEVDPQLVPLLEAKAAEALDIAQTEEQDSSPTRLMPDISCYTA